MRPAPICTDIPGYEAAVRASERAVAYHRGGVLAMAEADGHIRDAALQGFATRYNQPCLHNGEIIVFVRGAFSDACAQTVDVRSEHDHSIELPGLELVEAKAGLAFRVPLPSTPQGYALQAMVRSFSKADVSVGCKFTASEVREVNSTKVRFVTKAKLVEISLVADGAMPYACASVIDLAKEPPLAEAASSGLLALDMSCQETLSSLKKLRRLVADED